MFGNRFWGPRYFGDRYWGEGADAPVPPTPDVLIPGAGKGARKRRYVRLSDGSTREIESDYDLRRVVEAIIAKNAENAETVPDKKKKRSKKIRQRSKPAGRLQNFASFDTLEAELAALDQRIFEERFIIELMLAIQIRQAIARDDEEVLMLLEALT